MKVHALWFVTYYNPCQELLRLMFYQSPRPSRLPIQSIFFSRRQLMQNLFSPVWLKPLNSFSLLWGNIEIFCPFLDKLIYFLGYVWRWKIGSRMDPNDSPSHLMLSWRLIRQRLLLLCRTCNSLSSQVSLLRWFNGHMQLYIPKVAWLIDWLWWLWWLWLMYM